MPTETGIVSRIEGNKMVITLAGGDHCSSCTAQSACSPLTSHRELELLRDSRFNEGDLVLLNYSEKQKLLFTFIVFVVPILVAIAGYFIGNAYASFPGAGIWGTLIGLLIGFSIPALINKLYEKNRGISPRIIKKVTNYKE